jgi:hypothetical protein
MLLNETCAQLRTAFIMMMCLLIHYHKVPTVEPALSMDYCDISNTAENTDAFNFAYQQLVTCHHVKFWGAFAKLRKATIKFVMSICLFVCPSVHLSILPTKTNRLQLDEISRNLILE